MLVEHVVIRRVPSPKIARFTPGKLVMGIKVTDEHGGRLGFGRAIVRALAKTLSHFLANFGFLMVALSLRKQGLHDVIAKTLVVRTR